MQLNKYILDKLAFINFRQNYKMLKNLQNVQYLI